MRNSSPIALVCPSLRHSVCVRSAPAARLAATVALALMSAGCSVLPGSDTPDRAVVTRQPLPRVEIPTPTAVPIPTDTAVRMAGRAPLTGVTTDVSALARPAFIAEVSNSREARPQRGLAEADIVFVSLIAPATTRLAPVFHSALPAAVGPVRSMQPIDAATAGPTRGVIASIEGADWVQAYVDQAADLDDLRADRVSTAGAYTIDRRRGEPNNVFANATTLLSVSSRKDPPPPYFSYAPDIARSSPTRVGTPATRVDIGYGETASAYWRYDPASSRWLRYEDPGPHVLEGGAHVGATNVLVLHTTRERAGFPQADAATIVLDFEQADGDLELLTGDHVVTGRWSKAGAGDPFTFLDVTGKPLLLAPGNTWVECVSELVPVVSSNGPPVGAPAG